MKALIVEDDPGARDALATLVEQHGFEVSLAEDGAEAWQMLDEEPFPIVLTDWIMPRMDGVELVKALRARRNRPYTYVIMLTARSNVEDFREGFAAGADDFLTKPCGTEELSPRLTVARRIMKLQRKLAAANLTLRQSNEELEYFKQRMQNDLEAAAAVQKSLLPSTMPSIPGLTISWDLRPSDQLAGDLLNLFRLDEHHVGVYVLDVSGHGVPAALLSVQLSRMLTPSFAHSQVLRQPIDEPPGYRLREPVEVMTELNTLFQWKRSAPQFFTLIYGILNIRTRMLRFTCAGHPGPILCRNGSRPSTINVPGRPIGMFREGAWTEKQVTLNPGDRLLLCSDGILEASNGSGEMFGDRRLVELVVAQWESPPETCCAAIMDAAQSWSESEQIQDDCSLLMIQLD